MIYHPHRDFLCKWPGGLFKLTWPAAESQENRNKRTRLDCLSQRQFWGPDICSGFMAVKQVSAIINRRERNVGTQLSGEENVGDG
jgi:hypothetical protein